MKGRLGNRLRVSWRPGVNHADRDRPTHASTSESPPGSSVSTFNDKVHQPLDLGAPRDGAKASERLRLYIKCTCHIEPAQGETSRLLDRLPLIRGPHTADGPKPNLPIHSLPTTLDPDMRTAREYSPHIPSTTLIFPQDASPACGKNSYQTRYGRQSMTSQTTLPAPGGRTCLRSSWTRSWVTS